jgi:hypothetical protein
VIWEGGGGLLKYQHNLRLQHICYTEGGFKHFQSVHKNIANVES